MASSADQTESRGMLLFDELLDLVTPPEALTDAAAPANETAENNDEEEEEFELVDDDDDDGGDDGADYDDVICDVCEKAVPHTDRVHVCVERECQFATCQRCHSKPRAQQHAHAVQETFNFTFAYRVLDDEDEEEHECADELCHHAPSVRRIADTHGALTLLLLSTEPQELNLITSVGVSPPLVPDPAAGLAFDPLRPLRIVTIRHAKVGDIEWHTALSDAALERLVQALQQFHPVSIEAP